MTPPTPLDAALARAMAATTRASESPADAPDDAALARQARADLIHRLDLPVTDADERMLAAGTIKQTRMVAGVVAWMNGDVPLLVMSGTPGRGKTIAACHAIVEKRGRYRRAREVCGLFLAQFGDERDELGTILATGGVLTIDDIGTERDPVAFCAALVDILERRRKRGRRNVWITNLQRAAFEARYDDPRLHSRMAECGTWLVDTGEDMRRKGT